MYIAKHNSKITFIIYLAKDRYKVTEANSSVVEEIIYCPNLGEQYIPFQ